jgi:hypothetical protein
MPDWRTVPTHPVFGLAVVPKDVVEQPRASVTVRGV